eukprot:TRINITY_DN55992_c0_g1_i1.p1 TRINITY_DN55992_c0_g1~~TRINITY_DN55992_c0_g1_i1.p1  ORF type:complete len:767 (+),score=152.60 TRINITY_DN55992_c0_g1_i1:43-2343(+)
MKRLTSTTRILIWAIGAPCFGIGRKLAPARSTQPTRVLQPLAATSGAAQPTTDSATSASFPSAEEDSSQASARRGHESDGDNDGSGSAKSAELTEQCLPSARRGRRGSAMFQHVRELRGTGEVTSFADGSATGIDDGAFGVAGASSFAGESDSGGGGDKGGSSGSRAVVQVGLGNVDQGAFGVAFNAPYKESRVLGEGRSDARGREFDDANDVVPAGSSGDIDASVAQHDEAESHSDKVTAAAPVAVTALAATSISGDNEKVSGSSGSVAELGTAAKLESMIATADLEARVRDEDSSIASNDVGDGSVRAATNPQKVAATLTQMLMSNATTRTSIGVGASITETSNGSATLAQISAGVPVAVHDSTYGGEDRGNGNFRVVGAREAVATHIGDDSSDTVKRSSASALAFLSGSGALESISADYDGYDIDSLNSGALINASNETGEIVAGVLARMLARASYVDSRGIAGRQNENVSAKGFGRDGGRKGGKEGSSGTRIAKARKDVSASASSGGSTSASASVSARGTSLTSSSTQNDVGKMNGFANGGDSGGGGEVSPVPIPESIAHIGDEVAFSRGQGGDGEANKYHGRYADGSMGGQFAVASGRSSDDGGHDVAKVSGGELAALDFAGSLASSITYGSIGGETREGAIASGGFGGVEVGKVNSVSSSIGEEAAASLAGAFASATATAEDEDEHSRGTAIADKESAPSTTASAIGSREVPGGVDVNADWPPWPPPSEEKANAAADALATADRVSDYVPGGRSDFVTPL